MALNGRFAWAIFIVQIIFIVIFAIFTEYEGDLDATHPKHNRNVSAGGQDPKENSINALYPMFQDINAMVFLGIGFLYAFLSKYSYSGIGMNFLMCAVCVQWGIITLGWWNLEDGKIKLDIHSVMEGEFAAASAVIAFGGIFGKTSPLQMLVFNLLEVLFYSTICTMCQKYLLIADVGQAVALHLFAAIFGCSATYVIDRKVKVQDSVNFSPNYNSNIFCLIGTLVLWVFWPSFNAASEEGDAQHRAVMNTYLSLIGGTITTFAMSSLLEKNNKFRLSHIQNATLAGAVGISTTANLMVHPYGALLIGSISGCISVCGFEYLSPLLEKIKVFDPCGINSLHGLPGLFAGFVSIITALMANEESYGYSLYKLFPAMAPEANSEALNTLRQNASYEIAAGTGRTSEYQALFQFVYIIIVMVLSLITGLITGLISQMNIFDPLIERQLFMDADFWVIPEKNEDGCYQQTVVSISNQHNGNSSTRSPSLDSKL